MLRGVKGVEEVRQKSGGTLDRGTGTQNNIRTWREAQPRAPKKDRCAGYFKNRIIRWHNWGLIYSAWATLREEFSSIFYMKNRVTCSTLKEKETTSWGNSSRVWCPSRTLCYGPTTRNRHYITHLVLRFLDLLSSLHSVKPYEFSAGITNSDICIRQQRLRESKQSLNVYNKMEHEQNTEIKLGTVG